MKRASASSRAAARSVAAERPERACPVRTLRIASRLARSALVALLSASALSVGCQPDQSPVIREVDRLRAPADPRGPFVVTARAGSGDGALRVTLSYSVDGRDPLDEACVDAPPDGRWRLAGAGSDADGGARQDAGDDDDAGPPGEPDAGVGAAPPCHRLALVGDGDVWRGTLVGPPFPLGLRVLYRLVAVDEDGDRAVWPPDGPAIFDVGWDRPLTVEALTPVAGPAAGGTEVLIRGAGFGPGLGVRFGGRAAVVDVVSAHLARARTPAGAAGPVEVVVTREAQGVRRPAGFVYEPPPTITRVDPGEVPAERAALLVVEGADFVAGASVAFGEAAGALVDGEVEVVDARRVVVTTPLLAPGTVDVVVSNPDGQQAVAVDALRVNAPPRLDMLAPSSGSDGGGTVVRVVGADLRAPGAVWFGARPALRVVVDPDGSGAEVVTPLHVDGVVDVTWYNPDGQSAVLPEAFRFVGPPVVDAVEPGVAGRCGGTRAILRGRNFEPDMWVTVDGAEAEVLEVSDDGTEAVIRMPRGDVGAARIEVVGPDGRVFRSDELVAYDRRPVIGSVEPARVPIWGQEVVVAGADLDAVSAVTVGERAARAFRVVDGDDPCDGRLLVDLPAGDDGSATLRLDDARGEAARLPAAVEYVAPVLEPASGLRPGYTNATMRGVGLVAGLTMTIGGRAPRVAQRLSDEEWAVVTPPGDDGPQPVRFSIAAAGRSATVDDGFTYRAYRDRTAGRLDAPGDCNDVEVADLDGDGTLDVVGAFGGMGGIEPLEQPPTVWLNDGAARFRRVELRPTGNGINSRLGDVDGDGDLDLLLANLSGPANRLFLNDGGSFSEVADFAGRDSSYDADFVDVDLDGDLDIFSLRIGSPDGNANGPEQLWLNDGRGRLSNGSAGLPFDLRDVHDHDFAHGDLDGDGLPDLVIVVDNLSQQFRTARNRVWMNRGGGRFEWVASPLNTLQGDWLDVELVDLDGDGDLDVLMPQDYLEGFSFPATPAMALWFNDGRGTLSAQHERVHGLPRLPAYEAVPVDLDADGDLDLLVAVFGIVYGDGTIDAFRSVPLLNDGTANWYEASGAFDGLLEIPSTNFGVGDFDGDGDLDLLECAGRGRSMLWMLE